MRGNADEAEIPMDLGLSDLDLAVGYDTAEQALARFYVPVLSRALSYDRSVGYFRASAIAAAARGLSHFIHNQGHLRLLVGAEVGEDERDALTGAVVIPPWLAERLASELVPEDEIRRRRLEVLAWLAKEGRLTVKVAIPVDDAGRPVPAGEAIPYFHEKIGILRDHRGDGVAFQGSVNESSTAWMANFESFSVYKSWDSSAVYFDKWSQSFEERWSGHVEGFRVFDLPDAVARALIALAPSEPPPTRDVQEPELRMSPSLLARFLLVAPRLAGADGLAEATSGVELFPHQRKVVARLAGGYPRSWLLADEVGLGKTISAGLALRSLLLSGEVGRVLVLAPANVCRQWQDELFEKFGLWVPRLDGNRIHGAHPDDVREVAAGANPYLDEPILLVSSHLARLPAHQARILAAPRLDLLVVDEAHHARRSGADLAEYRPTRLLQFLDRMRQTDHARATWLLTATPMQVHPIELCTLLGHVGLQGSLAEFSNFERYFTELARDDVQTNWPVLAKMLQATPLPAEDDADRAFLDRIRTKLGPVHVDRIRRFGQPGQDSFALATDLGLEGRRELRAWLRQRGPVGQYVTRHTRDTMRRYYALGLLKEPIATRDVRALTIQFTPEEQALYEGLDDLLDRLMLAHGKRRGAGFVLTIYRRRLTSSWEAIRRTLRRRVERERLLSAANSLDVSDVLDEVDDEDLDSGEGGSVDDHQAIPLSNDDISQIEGYLDDLDLVHDSKFDRLTHDLDDARGSAQPVIVFTQFADTLDYLRGRLHASYRSHLATYSGSGGSQWLEDSGWVGVSKQELVEALRSRRISVILATDAASEGLNLQVASYLINFDLPWNPMRVEQRIGRIDRIGQVSPVVTVRNYVIPGTVEEDVYKALAARIDLFSGVVGKLQPILGATEGAFKSVFRAPRSERRQVQQAAIEGLLHRVGELELSGIDLGDDDAMPDRPHPEPPLTLAELKRCLVDELGITLDQTGRPATFERSRASRDHERWTSLATYGHPALRPALSRLASGYDVNGPLIVAEVGERGAAYRSDRTPPQRVGRLSDLDDLGAPVSATEATELARRDAEAANSELVHRRRTVLAAQRERWERSVRERFRDLVHRVVAAGCALHRRSMGTESSPSLIWLELRSDEMSGWCNADAFRQHLRMDVADVVPTTTPDDGRSEVRLRQERSLAGAELVALITEWLDATAPAEVILR